MILNLSDYKEVYIFLIESEPNPFKEDIEEISEEDNWIKSKTSSTWFKWEIIYLIF